MIPRNARAASGYLLAAVAVGGIALILWAFKSHLPVSRAPPGPSPAEHAPAALSARDLVGVAGTALEACPLPTAPSVPDSTRASLDDMKAARAAFAAYDAATNAYAQCVDSAIARTARQYAGVASESDLRSLNEFGARAHNAAIDQEKAIVDQFNAQVRDYQKKHPR